MGHFHLLLKTLKYKYYPKFRTCPKYFTDQTRTVTFPDQEKLLEKVDDG